MDPQSTNEILAALARDIRNSSLDAAASLCELLAKGGHDISECGPAIRSLKAETEAKLGA